MNHLSLNPIYGGTGQLTHFVGIQMDVTELCARMSHEIRTPLNGMIAVGQLLAETKLSPAQDDLVSTIRSSGESLLTLISDILDFSRIEAKKISLRLQSFDLQGVIESAFEMAYTIAESCPPEVLGDPNRLQQVLLNLLINAVKFTDVGEVVMEVWAEELPRNTTTTTTTTHSNEEMLKAEREQLREDMLKGRKAYLVHFKVRDTGIGISRDGLRLLFRSFSQVDDSPTRKYGGSGLGLAISQRLCEAMGGTMWAESEGPGCGSTFQCTVHAHCGGPALKKALSLSNLHSCSNMAQLEGAWAVPPPTGLPAPAAEAPGALVAGGAGAGNLVGIGAGPAPGAEEGGEGGEGSGR